MLRLPSSGIQRAESLHAIRARVLIAHLGSFAVFAAPTYTAIIVWAIATYFLRVFAWEVGSHRYFSHRSFKTSRVFQTFLAALAAAAGQRGPLWWACTHRRHHRLTETEGDPHSPDVRGFWYAHIGWILERGNCDTDLDTVRDLAKFPELIWINKYHYLFSYGAMVLIFLLGQYTSLFGAAGRGVAAVAWIFFLSTTLSIHATFAINAFTHGGRLGVFHGRNFDITDSSTNCWLLSIPTMGSSWHNNHHRYMNAARAGFYWWEIDLAYLVLRCLAILGVVWDLHQVPRAILEEGRLKPNSLSGESKR